MMQRLSFKSAAGLFLVMLLSASAFRSSAQTYCTPSYTSGCTYQDDIHSFIFNAVSNSISDLNTGCNGTGGYANRISLFTPPPTVLQGGTYTGSVTTEYSSGEYYTIWIDFNNDGIFQQGAGTGGLGNENLTGMIGPFGSGAASPFSISIPLTAAAGIHRMRVRLAYYPSGAAIDPCTNEYYGETHDYNVNVIALTPCAGTPTGGTAYANPNPVCPNRPFTLIDTAATVGGGITYQWEQGTTSTGPWTPITGATSNMYTVTAGITATSYYRFKVTCTNTAGATVYSNVITETIAPVSQCYCIPQYSFGCLYQDDINTITLVAANSTGFNQPNTGCSPGGYIYYNNLPAFSVAPGCTYSGTINSEFSGSEYVRIWIDFNDDGTFNNTNESVGTVSNFGTTLTPYTITIPAVGSAAGVHRMRYRLVYATTANTIDPCISYTYGETHDYNVTVIAGSATAPTVINNGPFCQPGVLTVTAQSGACAPTYTITGPTGVTMPPSNSSGIFTITNPVSGTYSVTVTSGGTTSPAGTTLVTIYPNPTLTLGPTTGPTTCATPTGTIQINGLLAGASYTVKYRKNGLQPSVSISPATATASGTYVITGLTQGIYDSIRVITGPGCNSNIIGPVTLSDPNPPVAPALSPNYPLCTGTMLTLTATASSGAPYPANAVYTFTGPGFTPGSSASNTATRANFTAANNGSYCAYVTVNSCQSATTCTNVTVTPASALPAVANISYCQNEFALPLTAVGTNIKIYDSINSVNPLPQPVIPNTSIPGTHTYYVTQSNPCEGARAALTVTIKPTPPAPVVISPIFFCQYEVVGALTAQGQALRWYTTATGGTGSLTAPVPVTTTPGTYNFYVSQTMLGCESPRAQITVTIRPKPAPPIAQPRVDLCQNDPPAPLTAIGQNLLWYTTPTGGGAGSPIAPVPNVGYEDSTYYYVSQTVNGCESDRAQMKVVVNYRPNGIIIASRPWTCAEDTLMFTYYGNGRPDAIYNWQTPHPQSAILSGDNTRGPLTVLFNTPGDQLITLQINNHGCLSPLITTKVNVRVLPAVSFAHSKDDICTDQIVNVGINHISGNISDYSWQGFDGATVHYGTYNGGPYGLSWSQPGTHIVQLVVTSNECNSHAAVDTINVHPYPDATIHYDGERLNICAGDSVRLYVTPGVDPAVYMWTPAAYFYNRSDSTPVVYVTPKYSGKIGVLVTSVYGCAARDSVDIGTRPCCGVSFPTAFSPNNDKHNDLFRPITEGNHEVKSFRVINRWGQVVYESKDERRGWDGTYNGVGQDMGVYHWYFRYVCSDGQDLEEKGEILLMR